MLDTGCTTSIFSPSGLAEVTKGNEDGPQGKTADLGIDAGLGCIVHQYLLTSVIRTLGGSVSVSRVVPDVRILGITLPRTLVLNEQLNIDNAPVGCILERSYQNSL